MKLLTSDSFKRARTFVMEQGRELERRLLSYYFDDGTPTAVLDELASYQNQDGGFHNGLEPDLQLPDSSVITTTIALRILREVKATSNDKIVQKGLMDITTPLPAHSQSPERMQPRQRPFHHPPIFCTFMSRVYLWGVDRE